MVIIDGRKQVKKIKLQNRFDQSQTLYLPETVLLARGGAYLE